MSKFCTCFIIANQKIKFALITNFILRQNNIAEYNTTLAKEGAFYGQAQKLIFIGIDPLKKSTMLSDISNFPLIIIESFAIIRFPLSFNKQVRYC